MNYFEKAVEDYAKKMKEFYDYKMQRDINRFNQAVEKMTADLHCRCGYLSPERRREIIAMEVSE